MHAVATYPGGTTGAIARALQRQRPSPKFSGVGFRFALFEACSAFTHVTACMLAESPEVILSIEGFNGFIASTAAPIATGWSDSCRVGLSPTEDLRLSRRTEKCGLKGGGLKPGDRAKKWVFLRIEAFTELEFYGPNRAAGVRDFRLFQIFAGQERE